MNAIQLLRIGFFSKARNSELISSAAKNDGENHRARIIGLQPSKFTDQPTILKLAINQVWSVGFQSRVLENLDGADGVLGPGRRYPDSANQPND